MTQLPTLKLEELEKEAYRQAIVRAKGRYSIAMRLLGVTSSTFYRRVKDFKMYVAEVHDCPKCGTEISHNGKTKFVVMP